MQVEKPSYFQLIKQISSDYWLILILIFLMKAGQFMLLPYLAIFLTKTTHASMSMIGFVVGAGPLAYGVVSPFGGYLIDRIGRRKSLIFSLFLGGVIFVIFNVRSTIFYYTIMNIGVGVTRALFDVASRSYKIHAMDVALKKFCFSLRFVMVNAGAALGPVMGLWLLRSYANVLFLAGGMLYLALSILIATKMKSIDDFDDTPRPPGILQVFKVMSLDVRLAAIVIASTLMWTSYSQLDSIFGIYVTRTFPQGIAVLTWAFIVNTACCVFLQMPASRLMNMFSERQQILIGTLFYMAGFFLIPHMLHVSTLLMACFVVGLGEIIVSPLIDLLVFKISPTNMIGSYYGASSISMLGVGIGPMMGGFFYENFNAKALFFFCAALFFMMGLLLSYSAKEMKHV